MKFPRHARILRGQLDAAPFITVFFLLVMFVLLSSLVYTPGVQIRLPVSNDQVGVEGPSVTVAVDKSGQFYYENQQMEEPLLLAKLRDAARNSSQPLTLVVRQDKESTRESQDRLAVLARAAGIHDVILATLPRVFDQPMSEQPNR
jgi:biopolymer transport protein ExbD